MKKPRVLALVGPTASGKTELSLLLAEQLNAEIVCADSRQIFKHLDIGTAKPTIAERRRVPHHLVDFLEPRERYSAGDYSRDAEECFEDLIGRGRTPVLVGGSGLYIKAAIDGLANLPSVDVGIRTALAEELRQNGLEPLVKELMRVDPGTMLQTNQLNPRRVLRALEVYRMTGIPLSEFHRTQRRAPVQFEFVQVGLRWERSFLNGRIDARVDWMMQNGLVQETQNLLRMGYGRELNALNTVGYKEVCDFLENNVGLEKTVELIKANTRRFAKRQMTWFNADKRIIWIDVPLNVDWTVLARSVTELFRTSVSEDEH